MRDKILQTQGQNEAANDGNGKNQSSILTAESLKKLSHSSSSQSPGTISQQDTSATEYSIEDGPLPVLLDFTSEMQTLYSQIYLRHFKNVNQAMFVLQDQKTYTQLGLCKKWIETMPVFSYLPFLNENAFIFIVKSGQLPQSQIEFFLVLFNSLQMALSKKDIESKDYKNTFDRFVLQTDKLIQTLSPYFIGKRKKDFNFAIFKNLISSFCMKACDKYFFSKLFHILELSFYELLLFENCNPYDLLQSCIYKAFQDEWLFLIVEEKFHLDRHSLFKRFAQEIPYYFLVLFEAFRKAEYEDKECLFYEQEVLATLRNKKQFVEGKDVFEYSIFEKIINTILSNLCKYSLVRFTSAFEADVQKVVFQNYPFKPKRLKLLISFWIKKYTQEGIDDLKSKGKNLKLDDFRKFVHIFFNNNTLTFDFLYTEEHFQGMVAMMEHVQQVILREQEVIIREDRLEDRLLEVIIGGGYKQGVFYHIKDYLKEQVGVDLCETGLLFIHIKRDNQVILDALDICKEKLSIIGQEKWKKKLARKRNNAIVV